MSISGTVPHRVRTSALSRRRFRGSGAASRSVSLIGPCLPRSAISSHGSFGSAASNAASSSAISPRSWSMNAVGSSGLRSAA